MREIKFRAWQDGSAHLTKPKMFSFETISKSWSLHEFLNPQKMGRTLMQFTGLTDKNGKEIYEGDILKTDLGSETFTKLSWQVVFEFGSFQLRNPNHILPISFVFHCYESIEHDDIDNDENYETHLEVIGNIYETPNLLNP